MLLGGTPVTCGDVVHGMCGEKFLALVSVHIGRAVVHRANVTLGADVRVWPVPIPVGIRALSVILNWLVRAAATAGIC